MLDRCRDFIEKNGKKEYADFSKFIIEERKKLKMISKRLILFNDSSVLNQLNSNNLSMEEK